MRATEHEMTVAVEAAAKQHYERIQFTDLAWEELDMVSKRSIKEGLLPLVLAVLEALPDRNAKVREILDTEGFSDEVRLYSLRRVVADAD